MIRAVVFDIDNTLVDHERAEREGAAQVFSKVGYTMPGAPSLNEFTSLWHAEAERYADMYAEGRVALRDARVRRVQGIFAHWGRTLTEGEAWDIYQLYYSGYEHGWHLFDDVRPCLGALGGYELGIISNGDGANQRRKLERVGILTCFKAVVISGDVGSAKPEPKIFLHAVESLNVEPDEALYVGDKLDVDVRGAKVAGLWGVWLNRTGTKPPEDVLSMRSLVELPGIIGILGRTV
jgi:putative hydrolase of the HAD superfamily